MEATVEQTLISKIRMLSSQQVGEVEDFVEFLIGKAQKRLAWGRLLSIAPTIKTAGADPLGEEEIATEVAAARAVRRAKADNVTGH
ncbi:MAG: hypothetical protein LBG78_01450 [Azoarcus sp.]|jgi:hypothetical protein|nr:hypothetical protein [Azoarcus sp.]